MKHKLYLPIAILIIFSMVLGACAAPAATPQTQVVEPTAPPVVAPSEAPPEPAEEPGPDVAVLLQALIDSMPPDKGYGTIKPTSLSEELTGSPPFLVDVREPSELENDGYIDGAVNIPIRALLNNLDKLPGLDDPIVIYCASGHRAGIGFASLKLLGYTNIRNLAGGTGGWKKANLPLMTGSMPVEPAAISQPIIADQALFAVLNEFISGLPDNFYTTKADKLAESLASSDAPILVDIRTTGEYDNDGYIDGALNLPMQEILANLSQIPDKDQLLVIYCVSGHRGSVVTTALRLLGYTNVINLAGGLNAWKAAQMPVVGWVDWMTTWSDFLASLPADQGYYTIQASALNERLVENPPFLVDLREAGELEDGYIEGAVHIPIRELLKNLDRLPGLDQPVVVYCASGHRGGFAVAALRLLGYSNVVNLAGGSNAWKNAELPLASGVSESPAAGTAPPVDSTRLAELDAFLSNLPEGFFSVKAGDLNTELASGPASIILDVRTSAEYAEGHLDEALNAPVNQLLANLSLVPDKEAAIVVLCKSGHRGAIAAMALHMLGYTNVRNLAGGMNAWAAAELPIIQ